VNDVKGKRQEEREGVSHEGATLSIDRPFFTHIRKPTYTTHIYILPLTEKAERNQFVLQATPTALVWGRNRCLSTLLLLPPLPLLVFRDPPAVLPPLIAAVCAPPLPASAQPTTRLIDIAVVLGRDKMEMEGIGECVLTVVEYSGEKGARGGERGGEMERRMKRVRGVEGKI